MHLASSTKHALLALGIGVTLAACGGETTPPDNTTYTWTKVSTDIKGSCATITACHLKGTTQPFSYDNTLAPGSDTANYQNIMAYIDKTTPANSQLITVGKGGQYMGRAHSSSLSAAKGTDWTNWITAGALFP